ncbi:hypothetical protein Cch01nite_38520 [Cellulomonas chitinilytica]|uniref:Uncharacterized protein n=1 Tax=Cellulomonas chitinilytica TaxID=398759 RepID=A0A919P6Z5_9CELL|nr:hypothetical protein Cch01nite_38520 [Cellulomonas chitinilytica]
MGPAPAARPRRTVVLLTVALVLAVALGAALVGRMLVTTHAWQRSSAGWEALARTHGADLATAQGELADAQAQLTDAQTQLATAQARITELADEKAQLGDTSAAQSQLADYQARVSQAAGNVATALAQCITGQQKLIGYLEESDRYDPADLARFKQDVTTVCGAATDANAALQRELSQ